MRDPWQVRYAPAVLATVVAGTALAGWGATQIESQVDFTGLVPEHEGLEPYRRILTELDGTRFSVVYMAAADTPLRDPETFDALVYQQQAFSAYLHQQMPGAFSHQLSVYEAMRGGHYMYQKVVTAGNPSADDYRLPEDDVTWDQVRQQVLDGAADDVLAQDGRSTLMLWFFATEDPLEARELAGEMDAVVAGWQPPADAVTTDHQTTGFLYASHYTDQLNRQQTLVWGLAAAAAAGVALIWAMRSPLNAMIAVLCLGVALAWLYGTMGWAGWRITLLGLFLAPIVVGVGVDYAMHVLYRFEEERGRQHGVGEAWSRALRGTGRAVAVTALTTALGLLVLLRVPARTFSEVGAIAALGIVYALISGLVLAPALRSLWRRHHTPWRDRTGPGLARLAARIDRTGPWVPAAALLLVVVAGTFALEANHIESGATDNEFPADDPVIVLQHRVEEEYGALQRAYLIVEGDVAEPRVLRGMYAASLEAAELPLYRDASSVADLLIADDKTDQGSADLATQLLLGQADQEPSDLERLPTTRSEADARLRGLWEDPFWRTITPFVITQEGDLAVMSVVLEPWQDQQELTHLRNDLRDHALRLQEAAGPGVTVTAAGAPMNRAAVIEEAPKDVTWTLAGATVVTASVLAAVWSRRPRGPLLALACAGIVAGAAILVLASIPILDAFYALAHEAWGWPANHAALGHMFLLALAITISAGIDDMVHLVHRYSESRRAGGGHQVALRAAFRHAGRVITGTTLTAAAAFGVLSGVYFLQSKNLAILTLLGVLYAYLLSVLVAPWLLRMTWPASD